MFKLRLLFVVAYLICQCRINAFSDTTFFRRDYTLYSEVKAFYKLHKDPKPWNEARKICMMEGAALAVPETADEAEVYKKILEARPEINAEVMLGIQAFSKGLFTALDGTSIDDIYNNWGPGEPNDAHSGEDCVAMGRQGLLNDVVCGWRFPFLCEKSQDDVKWNEDCQIPDLDYHRVDGMENCYKMHVKQKNWSDAYATCKAEQSYLAVLNSQAEWEALQKLFNSKPRGRPKDGHDIIHLGFHDRYGEGEFTTIQGVPLAESGFNQWHPGQPDHPGGENCGSMFTTGKLNDITCSVQSFFICEHEDGSGLALRKSG